MSSFRTAVITATVSALGLALASCSAPDSPDDTDTAEPTTTATQVTAAEETGVSESPQPVNDDEPSTAQEAPCAAPDLDLAESPFGIFLPAGKLALDGSDWWFHFTVEDNQFDPCAALSWITVSGVTGEAEGPAPGAGESPSEAVIFFRHDEPVTEPAPLLSAGVSSVERTADTEVTVTYGVPGASLAEGIVGETDVTYTLDGDVLVEDEQAQAAVSNNPTRLNLGVNPPPGPSALNPYGNINYPAWDEEMAPGRMLVPMGDTDLMCDISVPGTSSDVYCENRGGAMFPLLNTGPLAVDPGMGDGSSANAASIHFSPPSHIATTFYPSGNMEIRTAAPDESVTRIGQVFVDTRGDGVVFSRGDHAYRLADGVAEQTTSEVTSLDQSRWPTDLAPWSAPR